jgi:dimethylaniline monooxygenase (N-oxide forming)
VDGAVVTFTDGTAAEVDALLLGTGFDLHLPFLDDAIAAAVRCSPDGLLLSDFTFHPDLPGLAFLGLWAQRGAYPVVLEQQARYLAYTWGGAVPAPSEADLRAGLQACVHLDHHLGYRQQNEMALRFARLAGVDPGGLDDPELQRLLGRSAVTGEMFRLVGTDARADAEQTLRDDVARFAPPEA